VILMLKPEEAAVSEEKEKPVEAEKPEKTEETKPKKTEIEETRSEVKETKPTSEPVREVPVAEPSRMDTESITSEDVHAGPGVRRLAREFGIHLQELSGTGHKGRILKNDLQDFVKQRLATPSVGIAASPLPTIDFSQYGAIETVALNKIKRLTGQYVQRSWQIVPHVTQFDEADITDLEAFRLSNKDSAEKQGFKLTLLVFVMKAVVAALKKFPRFNASLAPNVSDLILKKYYNIGVAVETPNGLVVPVIRQVDQKGFLQLAKELADISSKAREKGLSPTDMEGSCFTISSLGGIGGTAFTPIVNLPDVAILGLSRAKMQPVYQEGEFVPRLIMPMSLSYDHRVIDGAEGARFSQYLASCLADIRRLLL
jgi:pyruvate dehydrogenase E2 component (dihydrolipoamide acetyltransferase)